MKIISMAPPPDYYALYRKIKPKYATQKAISEMYIFLLFI